MHIEAARRDEGGDLVAAHAVGAKNLADIPAALLGAALLFRLELCREIGALLPRQIDQRAAENALRLIVAGETRGDVAAGIVQTVRQRRRVDGGLGRAGAGVRATNAASPARATRPNTICGDSRS